MNFLHDVGLHEHPAFWNIFGMPLPVDLQIVVLQAFGGCTKLAQF